MPRHTLARAFECKGVAIHSGDAVRLAVKPAPGSSGLHFVRVDLDDAPLIPARCDAIASASLSTTLAAPCRTDALVATVEHLLAALSAAGVDDARIEIDGPEVPVMDGSAAPFWGAIAKAGLRAVDGERREIVVTGSIDFEDGGRRVAVHPADAFSFDVAIDFDHRAIGKQAITCAAMTPAWFATEIAPARTFGFFADVETFRAQGLARGASFENTIVLGEDGVMNEGGLRFEDEYVRHKALDLMGDLTLLGASLRGRVEAVCAGHALHHRLVEAVLSSPDCWHWSSPV